MRIESLGHVVFAATMIGLRILGMMAAACILDAWFASDFDRHRISFATGAKGVRIAQVLFSLALIYFGTGHIVFHKQTASDVPAWLPWHIAGAYLPGFAFIAAGLAILVACMNGWQPRSRRFRLACSYCWCGYRWWQQQASEASGASRGRAC